MYGSLRDNVGVESVTEVDGVDVVAKGAVSLCLVSKQSLEWYIGRTSSRLKPSFTGIFLAPEDIKPKLTIPDHCT